MGQYRPEMHFHSQLVPNLCNQHSYYIVKFDTKTAAALLHWNLELGIWNSARQSLRIIHSTNAYVRAAHSYWPPVMTAMSRSFLPFPPSFATTKLASPLSSQSIPPALRSRSVIPIVKPVVRQVESRLETRDSRLEI